MTHRPTEQRMVGRVVGACAVVLAMMSASAPATTTPQSQEPEPWSVVRDLPYGRCFDAAAVRYGVDANLLRAIAWQESRFNPHANNTDNATPSEDIGVMQINSWWLTNGLEKYGIGRNDLWEPCLNIHVGAWILSQEVARHREVWTAVGYYNAVTDWKRERYSNSVKTAYRDLLNGTLQAKYKALLSSGTGAKVRAHQGLAVQVDWGKLKAIKTVAGRDADQTRRLVSTKTAVQIRRKPEIRVVRGG